MFNKIILLFLLLGCNACSSSSASSQSSIDIRACNAISYGNKNTDIQSMDSIYKKCMNDKNNIRKKQKSEAKNSAMFEFLVDLFFQTKKNN